MEHIKRYITSEDLFEAILDTLSQGHQASFTVTGMSMWPFLCHGRDQVILETADNSALKKGDVVLLQTPLENYILHRITSLTDTAFETTGDGNCFRDGTFPISCMKAKAVRFIRNGKEINCSSMHWKAIFHIWMMLFPVRRYLFAIWKKIRPFFRK